MLLPPVQFGQGCQSRKFFVDDVDGAGVGEGMVQELAGGGQVAYAQDCLAVESGGSMKSRSTRWTCASSQARCASGSASG